MGTKILLIIILLGGVALAVRAKMSNNRWRSEQVAVVDSPMTEAIGQILGIAGGIYLSLVMVLSFLGVEDPQEVMISGLSLDPLAILSVMLACAQPLLLRILRRF